jgi:hypothetical protein
MKTAKLTQEELNEICSLLRRGILHRMIITGNSHTTPTDEFILNYLGGLAGHAVKLTPEVLDRLEMKP